MLVVVYTYRGEAIRLISARKASHGEREQYDFSKGKRGPVIPQPGKTRITLWIDNNIIAEFRQRAEEAGKGYQTVMSEALRKPWGRAGHLLDEESLRRVPREELPRTSWISS